MSDLLPRWPRGYAPGEAALHVSNEMLLPVRAASVWSWLTRPDLWPSFYRHSAAVQVESDDHRLHLGVSFRWRALGVPVRSIVCDFEPVQRLSWYAGAFGIDAFHTWLLRSQGARTLVRTDETQNGLVPVVAGRYIGHRLRSAHQEWLNGLGRVGVRDPPPWELTPSHAADP